MIFYLIHNKYSDNNIYKKLITLINNSGIKYINSIYFTNNSDIESENIICIDNNKIENISDFILASNKNINWAIENIYYLDKNYKDIVVLPKTNINDMTICYCTYKQYLDLQAKDKDNIGYPILILENIKDIMHNYLSNVNNKNYETNQKILQQLYQSFLPKEIVDNSIYSIYISNNDNYYSMNMTKTLFDHIYNIYIILMVAKFYIY